MNFKITVLDDSKVIVCDNKGKFDFEMMLASINAVIEVAKAEKNNLILFDYTNANIPDGNSAEFMKFVEESTAFLSKGIRIAIVCSNDKIQPESTKYIQNEYLKRDSSLKLFPNISSALEWLKSS